MRRTIVAAFPLALVFSCFSASPTFADAGWEACVSAPHRACVLDELLEAGSAGKSAASRASVIASVSAAQARAGLSADAAKSLARALEEAQALEAPERDLPRAAIAVAEADAGDFAAAMGSAGSVEAVPLRIFALVGVARALQRAGRAVEAGAVFSQAMGAAGSISGDERVRAFTSIAEAQASGGLPAAAAFDAAVSAAKAQQPDNNSFWVVAARAEAGELKEAMRDAQAMKESDRVFVLAALAKALAAAGDLDGAAALVPSISTEGGRVDAGTAVAIAAAKAGKTEQAAGLLQQALEVANAEGVHIIRPELLAEIAGAEALAGLATRADAHLAEAQAAVSGQPEFDRDDLINAVAVALARAGRDRDARAAAKAISSDFGRALALKSVAKEEAEAKDFSGALCALLEITPNSIRLQELFGLAAKLPN